jgi:protein phosphatase
MGNRVTIFNVGDSRAYLLTDGANGPPIKLLSRDHTALNDMIDDDEITLAQSENAASFLRGLSSQFMADADCDDFRVNIITLTWQTGERILLCSDGLNEVLSDSAIAKALVNHSLADLMQVCKASRRAGGFDDFSVLVLVQI